MSKDLLVKAGSNELEIIEFFIFEQTGESTPASHYFGVNVAKVLEIIESPAKTPAESAAHPSFFGTIPLRERILPVLDLSVLLGIERARTKHEIILVTEFNNKVTGFLASGVTQIHRVEWSDVAPPAKSLGTSRFACVNGLVRVDDRFVLLLDLERFLADFDRDFGGRLTAPVQPAKRRYTALLVEDSRTMRDIISQRLSEANFCVRTTSDGEEAWKLLRQYRDNPDLQEKEPIHIVISDIEMPRLDGFALTKRVKEDELLRNLPVVLFSSLITDALRHKGNSVGADDQVSKPEFVELADRAQRLIERYAPNGDGGD
ncbi:chemotaxis protein [Fundidesulfovibrio butyratiphilus]